MSRYYYSVYGPLIKQFIDAKRTFGYKYAMVEQECAGSIGLHMITMRMILVYLKDWQLNGVLKNQTNRSKPDAIGFRL